MFRADGPDFVGRSRAEHQRPADTASVRGRAIRIVLGDGWRGECQQEYGDRDDLHAVFAITAAASASELSLSSAVSAASFSGSVPASSNLSAMPWISSSAD